jgi:hypothetical protein
LTDPDEIMRLYTRDTHAMYCEMTLKSDLRIEVLPYEHYRELVRAMPDRVELVSLIKDDRIVGFGWCLHDGDTYHMMYAGIDYAINRQYDLYFNLMYAGFDRALRKGVKRIHVGQTATGFKARMGCFSEPRYIYAKGIGFFMSRIFRYGSNFLVIKKPSNPPSDIFQAVEVASPKSRRAARRAAPELRLAATAIAAVASAPAADPCASSRSSSSPSSASCSFSSGPCPCRGRRPACHPGAASCRRGRRRRIHAGRGGGYMPGGVAACTCRVEVAADNTRRGRRRRVLRKGAGQRRQHGADHHGDHELAPSIFSLFESFSVATAQMCSKPTARRSCARHRRFAR